MKAPHKVLDYLRANCGFKNDAAIADAWGVNYPILSKIRHGILHINAKYILCIYDTTDLTIEQIRDLL